MPYAVMFDEDCEGDTDFCSRILPPLIRTTKSLAAVGDGGRFVRAQGAGHDIFSADPALVQQTIDEVFNDAK
jgi:pimeloyl-ACP methyl ester carboxylesterase